MAKRTHSCGELTEKAVKKKVVLKGWVHNRRDHGGLTFIDLRDREGITQVVFNPEKSKKNHELARGLGKEFVIEVHGTVQKRPKGTENKKIKTGGIEVEATELLVLNPAEQPLPLELEERIPQGEEVRLKYRYLDLRKPRMQRNIILRHKVSKAVRDYFDSKGFLEIETPFMTKSTPEGSRDYLVPSRLYPGKVFALPQSPQLFKQILMIAGYEKYFQIVRCMRDEDLRADRQPEFTQIDVEMSFVEREDVMGVVEGMIKYVYKKVLGQGIKTPFPCMSYEEAMSRYGSDKPDTRFGLELCDVSDLFEKTDFNIFRQVLQAKGKILALCAPKSAGFSKKEIDELTETAKIYKAKGLVSLKLLDTGFDSSIAKFLDQKTVDALAKKLGAKKGDLIVMVADEPKVAQTALGAVRLFLGNKLGLIDKTKNNFLWVIDFPLLEFSEEEGKFVACHHPFTSPKDEDLCLFDSAPEKMKAKAYDIVLNGVELGGGSIRIHRRELQEKMFKALGFTPEDAKKKFGFLLDAFRYGAPPHGGIALGLDRWIMLMLGEESIREVIAFPKNKACISMMDESPSEVTEKQLKELGLKLDLSK